MNALPYAFCPLGVCRCIELSARTYGLAKDSIVLLEQIRTLDKRRLRERMGCLDAEAMQKVDSAIAISFGLDRREIETML